MDDGGLLPEGAGDRDRRPSGAQGRPSGSRRAQSAGGHRSVREGAADAAVQPDDVGGRAVGRGKRSDLQGLQRRPRAGRGGRLAPEREIQGSQGNRVGGGLNLAMFAGRQARGSSSRGQAVSGGSGWARRQRLTGFGLTLPALVFAFAFTVYPVG